MTLNEISRRNNYTSYLVIYPPGTIVNKNFK